MNGWIKTATCGVALAFFLSGTTVGKDTPPKKDGAACGEYGTSFFFEETPADAAKTAKKDGKLVMVLHVSGHFEDPGLT
jgi:hypothetical protein